MNTKNIEKTDIKQYDSSKTELLEQTLFYEKKIYDLEQLLDIAKSFCSTLDFNNLLESIVYIGMAQMHVLGAEIFVKDSIENKNFVLETAKEIFTEDEKLTIPVSSPIVSKLQELNAPVTLQFLKESVDDSTSIEILECLSPTLIVPVIHRSQLNGILILQERIAIEDDTSYTDYEKTQIMSIASLASVAINNTALLERSSTDMMTHLKLKFYFYYILTETLNTAHLQNYNIAVLMFDIDFFKKFNDNYGHECGDFVITSIADLIKQSLRDTDIASRYGGEEFTVLLDKTGKEEAMLVAERIRQKIETTEFKYNDQLLHVTISCGVSVFDIDKNPVTVSNELVNQSDKALYYSKEHGRNKVSFFNPEQSENDE